MGGSPVVPIILILVNVVIASTGQLLLKYGISLQGKFQASQGMASSMLDSFKCMFTPYVFLGLCLYAVSAVIWIRILKQVNLSFAYPMISLSYVLVVVLSALILREKVPMVTVGGLALICCGVSLIGIGYGVGK